MSLVVIEYHQLEELITVCVEKAVKKSNFHVIEDPSSDQELIQIDEAAKILNVSVSTLHIYKKRGIIPFHRIGRRIYFRKSEILESLTKIN
jgi:excisionase family DNA binding protein